MVSPLSRIEGSLLYRALPNLNHDRILALLNAIRPADQSAFRFDESGGFANDALCVKLFESAEPLPVARFTSALGASLTRIKAHDYSADVAAHRAHVSLSVSDREHGRAATYAGMIEKIVICQRVALAINRQARAELLYWPQSDMLFTTEELHKTAVMDFPVTLVTRPELYAGGRDPMGRERFGLRAVGAEMFLGKPLVFAVTARPVEELLALADFLILQHVTGEVPMTHGDVYHLSARDELRITHLAPSPAMSDGAIRVTMARRLANRTSPPPVSQRPASPRPAPGFGLPRAG